MALFQKVGSVNTVAEHKTSMQRLKDRVRLLSRECCREE